MGRLSEFLGLQTLFQPLSGFRLQQRLPRSFRTEYSSGCSEPRQANFEQLNGGDVSHLSLAMGQYPRWILIGAAVLMFAMCFAISWWIEAAYVKWWIRRKDPTGAMANSKTNCVVRNANLLSYAMLAAISLCILGWV